MRLAAATATRRARESSRKQPEPLGKRARYSREFSPAPLLSPCGTSLPRVLMVQKTSTEIYRPRKPGSRFVARDAGISARAPAKLRPATRPATRPSIADESLDTVREEAAHCRACPLWRNATQTVFGEGAQNASIMLVGEQPGDQEDRAGRPFVGPAGRLLDRALAAAGVKREATYVTNAVKHFKFELRGKRRLHKKPNELEIRACHQWLERELSIVQPQLIVALGATAARAVFGRATAIEKNRGKVIPAAQVETAHGADVLVTVHPSFLLRVPDEDRALAFERFVADLKLASKYVE